MMFACLQENLEKGINTVSRAIPIKSAYPILSNILIETENGRLKLAATNQDTTISTYVGASIDKEGRITLPAKTLKELIANLAQGTLNAHLLNETLHIAADKSKSKLNGTSADEFPKLPTFSKENPHLEIAPKDFANAVASVAFAAATDDSRPIFTGVYFSYDNETLTIAASDGFRLSEKTIPAKGNLPKAAIIIPAKTILEVSKIFNGAEEPIRFALNTSENLAVFYSGDTMVATRIIDGTYPDYKRIIPANTVLSAEFSAGDLLEAVKLTSIFAKELSNALKLKISSDGTVKVISASQESGEHLSEIPATVEGDSLDMAFNSKYLFDFLNNVKADRIQIMASGALSPCIIKSMEDEQFIHIVMPMQVQ